jgi:hypothetical protein
MATTEQTQMSSGYSIRIIVGAGIPGHAAIQIDGPDSTRYLGMGPVAAGHAISDGSYDVSSLPKNVSPIGILRDPRHDYDYINSSKYSVKSFRFAITEQQAKAALTAAANYQASNPRYNFFNGTICTDFALKVLQAAIPGSDLSRLDRLPSTLQNQLTDVAKEGRTYVDLGVPVNPHLAGIQLDDDPPGFQVAQWYPMTNSAPDHADVRLDRPRKEWIRDSVAAASILIGTMFLNLGIQKPIEPGLR